jgi:hypothetical protein
MTRSRTKGGRAARRKQPVPGTIVAFSTASGRGNHLDPKSWTGAWLWGDEDGARENAEVGGHRAYRLTLQVVKVKEIRAAR